MPNLTEEKAMKFCEASCKAQETFVYYESEFSPQFQFQPLTLNVRHRT